jgi:transposase
MSVTSDISPDIPVNAMINNVVRDTAIFLETEIKRLWETRELFKKILKMDPDNANAQQQIQELTAQLQTDIKALLDLRRDSEFLSDDMAVIIRNEGFCPDCGEKNEHVGQTTHQRSFDFNESFEDWRDVALTEQRFKAFTHSSSFVGNVRYDSDTNKMTMVLNGESYDFCDVPERKFDALEGATSVGKTFNDTIKGQHDC